MKSRSVIVSLGLLALAIALSFMGKGCDKASRNNPTYEVQSIGTPVKVGADIFFRDRVEELRGKRLGLVMNPTSRTTNGVHVLDSLLALKLNVTALFAAEHGFRGDQPAGQEIVDGKDVLTGLTVHSLYGNQKKPSRKQLEQVDVLIFDMQDVGARFYTYISTLGLVLEAAAEHRIPVWLFDRPNPNSGIYVDGPILESKFQSFVGAFPIPIAHGMTIGELAKMMIEEAWINYTEAPELEIIACENYTRAQFWPQTGLNWRAPSPNLQTWEQAFAYLGTCLIEGTTASEGRGTDYPFLLIGAPNLTIPPKLNQSLRKWGYQAVDTTFTPVTIPGKALNPKHENKFVNGVLLKRITTPEKAAPVMAGFTLLHELYQENKDHLEINRFMNNLIAHEQTLKAIKEGVFDVQQPFFQKEAEQFKQARLPYLMYK